MAVKPAPADLLPHAHPMVLLDSVESWSEEEILCSAQSHRRADHPLRVNGRVSIFCGLEYAAQAMAAHNRLTAETGGAPRQGFLATASRIHTHATYLDEVPEPLWIRAVRAVSSGDSSLYDFTVSAGGRQLLEGQLMVVKDGRATT